MVLIIAVCFLLKTILSLDPFKCDENKMCSPGFRCEDSTCVVRLDCPMLSMPLLKSGCKLNMKIDENGCPMPYIQCNQENLRCGSIFCSPGFQCNSSTTLCVPRTDCLYLQLPPQEGCIDMMELDEFDCLKAIRTCRKIEITNMTKIKDMVGERTKRCPKNSEWSNCSNLCDEKSCENYMSISSCFSLRCGPPACVCKKGYVFLSNSDRNMGCVPNEVCREPEDLTLNQRSRATRFIFIP